MRVNIYSYKGISDVFLNGYCYSSKSWMWALFVAWLKSKTGRGRKN